MKAMRQLKGFALTTGIVFGLSQSTVLMANDSNVHGDSKPVILAKWQQGSGTRSQGSSTRTQTQGSSNRNTSIQSQAGSTSKSMPAKTMGSDTKAMGSDSKMMGSDSKAMGSDTKMMGSDSKAMGSGSKMMAKVAMNGYCPVCIIAKKQWVKGDAAFASTFDGMVYHFPSASVKAMFDKSPEKYVPALNGDCIVCMEKAGKRVPGSVYHAAAHRGRVFLFPGDAERQQFLANPNAYAKTDLAVNGECIVCLVKANKHVPGTSDFTVMHNGMRYQFPSAKEADMFRASPMEFVKATMKMMPNGQSSMPAGSSSR